MKYTTILKNVMTKIKTLKTLKTLKSFGDVKIEKKIDFFQGEKDNILDVKVYGNAGILDVKVYGNAGILDVKVYGSIEIYKL